MKVTRAVILPALLLLAVCSSAVTEKEKYSTFLTNYNDINKGQSASGKDVLYWKDKNVDFSRYQYLVYQPMIYFPRPKPSEMVSQRALDNILILFYGVIIIHDIPYLLAKKRQHPHQDAIHVAGWVSLFTLHAIWPLLWIWATLYRPERGWGMSEKAEPSTDLQARIALLEAELQRLQEKPTAVSGPTVS